uniref:Choline/carnitine acyltransferase domain-containing protein n=1 Tax=Clastoptera arizonana TaxID=38151 RepID=A0A1B6CFU1_9HEMI
MAAVSGQLIFKKIYRMYYKDLVQSSSSNCTLFLVKIRSFSSNPEDQFIQQSNVPTLHFQPSLPRLPIPDLLKTCERYKRAQKPLLNKEDYQNTKSLIKEFCKKDGAELQKILKNEDAQNKHTSYISGPWFDMYLSDRKPLPINYNPFLVFINGERPEYNKQVVRAANLVVSSLRFKKSLDSNLLEPEVFHLDPRKSDTRWFRTFTGALPASLSWYGAYLLKAFPLDMSQYNNLFNTNRIPQIGKDKLYHDGSQKHILVLKNGNAYIFDVIDGNGNIVDPSIIYVCLQYINSNQDRTDYPVGLLTTSDRDKWAISRKYIESLGNDEVFRLIDGSLFVLALDSENGGCKEENLVRAFLHSDGTNRWFDKSFSLIVAADGVAGINFEHSWGDGVAVLRYFQDIFKDSNSKPRVHPDTQCTIDPSKIVRKLEFKLDDNAKNLISEVKQNYSKTYTSLGVKCLEFNKFGRNLCKKHKMSPDSVMQLAFQLAYDLLHDKQVATYESCSTAAFKHGRTETMRPCTVETKEFCEAIKLSKDSSKSELREMMTKCSSTHGNLIKEAAMGQGFDRHLFALKRLADLNGRKIPFFQDPAYTLINHNILSTSTLSSDIVFLGAFGPVVNNGFGIGYSIWEDRLGAIVTNYDDFSDGSGFISCLETSLKRIYDILKN